ncbi:GNAT family N-acetyltransferase [Actinoplanes sp. NPDC051513]|uniref:GNAT family N-acetyltransferase n=1 Tax=Actinoplanes sp. NPDC051513 TaxID=3363908 RepID=UPI00379686E7
MRDLIVRWQRGWGVARGLPAADDLGNGLRVRSLQPGRDVEYIAYHAGDLDRLAGQVRAERDVTWLTVPTTEPARTAGALEAAGLILLKRAEQLMTIELPDHPDGALTGPYGLEVGADRGVVTATVRHESGQVAAKGTMGLSEEDAVADRIETMPAHRRRGLARVVMGALARTAAGQGAEHGILIASQDGQRLYATLGWRTVAEVLIATTPGNSYPS